MEVEFRTVDVFTDRPFGGNPLAVIVDASGLSGPQMQAIAAEFGYSETTFLLPPDNPAHTARVRIFTPKEEIPFAGHPNVGTAYICATLGRVFGRPVGDRLVFEELAGLVPVDLARRPGGIVATLTAPQPLQLAQECDPAAVAAAVGLPVSAVLTTRHRPVVASVGLAFLCAELDSSESLSRAAPDLDAFRRHLSGLGLGLHLYTRTDGKAGLSTRMFAPLSGVWEDPATGSANAALIGLIAQIDPVADGEIRHLIAQGIDMGRPSLISAMAHKRHGTVTEIRIGGSCVGMMRGVLSLPPGDPQN